VSLALAAPEIRGKKGFKTGALQFISRMMLWFIHAMIFIFVTILVLYFLTTSFMERKLLGEYVT
jgi:hypothetical protein